MNLARRLFNHTRSLEYRKVIRCIRKSVRQYCASFRIITILYNETIEKLENKEFKVEWISEEEYRISWNFEEDNMLGG